MIICGIYKIENLINGKVYIGQSVDVEYRFRNHKSESFNPNSNSYDTAIHRAIRKHGIENFSFEVIEECDEDKLKEREIYWIDKYGSYGKGYNMTYGGEGVPAIDIKRVCELWDKGLSIGEISDLMKHNKHSVIYILENYENYSNEESNKRGRLIASKKTSKKIKQYDLNGNFITIYDSIQEAANAVNTRRSNISSVLIGKQLSSAGYQWCYEDDNPPDVYKANSTNEKRPVVQLDKNKQFVAEYESISDATHRLNFKSLGNIWACCNGKTKTAGGFYWMYKDIYECDLAAH